MERSIRRSSRTPIVATANGELRERVPVLDEHPRDECFTGIPYDGRPGGPLNSAELLQEAAHHSATASPEASMNDPDSSAETQATPRGLQLAYAALAIPLAMLVLSWFVPLMRPRWDSSAIPILSLIGGLLPAIAALSLSIGEWRRQRSRGAFAGLLLGLAAVPVCLAIASWLAMQGIGSHPV